jgi:hypothetical protein
MKRFTVLLTALTLSFAAAAEAKDDKPSEIQELMGKLNKPTGLFYAIGKELREGDPMWADIQPAAKEVAKEAARLGKLTPPKGDKDSWAKLTKEYADNAAALEKAVAGKNQAAAKAAFAKIDEPNCKKCHDAHRKQ